MEGGKVIRYHLELGCLQPTQVKSTYLLGDIQQWALCFFSSIFIHQLLTKTVGLVIGTPKKKEKIMRSVICDLLAGMTPVQTIVGNDFRIMIPSETKLYFIFLIKRCQIDWLKTFSN